MRLNTIFFVLLGASITGDAQVGPFPGTNVSITGVYTQTVPLAKGTTPILTNITLDTNPAGGDKLDINVGDAAVAVSLITPGGTEITAANAASLGYIFTVYTTDGTDSDTPAPILTAGTPTVIDLPAGASAGVYNIKTDTSAAAADSGMTVTYYPSAGVSTGATTDASAYRLGDSVILSVFLFDGTNPVQTATVTATAYIPVALSGSVGSFQLVSTEAASPATTRLTYSAQVTNASGSSATGVTAAATSSDTSVILEQSTLIFGTVAAGGTAPSANNLIVDVPTGTNFNPSSLTWAISMPSAPIQVTLTDSGMYDAATGDGIFTGVMTPSVSGDYTAFLNISGTSPSGLAFARNTAAAFHVRPLLARLGTPADSVALDSNGHSQSLNITFPITVQAPGKYLLTLGLKASNGKVTGTSVAGTLAAGSQQL